MEWLLCRENNYVLLSIAESGSRNLRPTEVVKADPFSTFAPLPSNGPAVEACNHFLAGMSNQIALIGPSGWGKSHLLEAILAHSRDATLLDVNRAVEAPGRLDGHRTLLLDNVQEVFGKPKQRQLLRLMLERRIKTDRPTVLTFTAEKPSRQIKQLLPAQRSWTLAQITAPAPEERVLIIQQLAHGEGLHMSQELVRIVAQHMHVNGRTLLGALKRLKLSGEAWPDSKATLRACGMLDPFFSDNPDWDLQHKIIKLSAESGKCPESSRDVALYTMMCVAGLPETDVARWAGIEPSTAYGRIQRFRKKLSSCEESSNCVKELVESVVGSLAA